MSLKKTIRNAIFIRLHTVYKHPELLLHTIRSRPAIMKKLTELHLKDAQRKWNIEYKELSPLSMFRKAINLSRNRYLKNKYLYHMIRYLEPKTVIETGVHYGISTAFMLQAMEDNKKGTLYSIDLPEAEFMTDICSISQKLPKGLKTGFLIPEKLKHNWLLYLGDAKELLENLCKEKAPLDLFHHDSEHTYKHMMFEFSVTWPHIRKGGLILLDDWDWNEAPLEFGVERTKEGTGIFNMYEYRGCILKY